ncbi:MAG: hypothetical protein ACYDCL_16140 [Myxococcales bacterium]
MPPYQLPDPAQPPQLFLRVPDAVRAPALSGLYDLIGYALFNNESQATPNPTVFPQSSTVCANGGLSSLTGSLPVTHISGWLRDRTKNFLGPVTTATGFGPGAKATSIPNRLLLGLNIANLDIVLGPQTLTGGIQSFGGDINMDLAITVDLTISFAQSQAGSQCNDEILLTPTNGPDGVGVQATNATDTVDVSLASFCALLAKAAGDLSPQAFANQVASAFQGALAGGFQINTPGYCLTEFDVKDQLLNPNLQQSLSGFPAYVQVAGHDEAPPSTFSTSLGREGIIASYDLSPGQSFQAAQCQSGSGQTILSVQQPVYYADVQLNDVVLRDSADDTSTQFQLQQGPAMLSETGLASGDTFSWFFNYNAPFDTSNGGFDDTNGIHLQFDFGQLGDAFPAQSGESCLLSGINWYNIPIAVPGFPAPSGPVFGHDPEWMTASGAVAFVTPGGIVTSDPAAFSRYIVPADPPPPDGGAADAGPTIPGDFLTPQVTNDFSGPALVQVFYPEPQCARHHGPLPGDGHEDRLRLSRDARDARGDHGDDRGGGDDCCDGEGTGGDPMGDDGDRAENRMEARMRVGDRDGKRVPRRHCSQPDGGEGWFYVTNQNNGDVLIFKPADGPWNTPQLVNYLCGGNVGNVPAQLSCTYQAKGVGPGFSVQSLRLDARTEAPGSDLLAESSADFAPAASGAQVSGSVLPGDKLVLGMAERERLVVVAATANQVSDSLFGFPAIGIREHWPRPADIACFLDANGRYAADLAGGSENATFATSFIPMPGDEVVADVVVTDPSNFYNPSALPPTALDLPFDNPLPLQGVPFDQGGELGGYIADECQYLGTANLRTPWSPNVGLKALAQPALVAAYALDRGGAFLVQLQGAPIGPPSSCYPYSGLTVYAAGVQGGKFLGPKVALLASAGWMADIIDQYQGFQTNYSTWASNPQFAELLGGWAEGGELFGFSDYLPPFYDSTTTVPYGLPIWLVPLQTAGSPGPVQAIGIEDSLAGPQSYSSFSPCPLTRMP